MNREQSENFVDRYKILECEIGSFVYGTNVETSDHDFCGIMVPPKEYYIGLESMDELDMSTVSKLASGKNSTDAIDKKFYSISKFVKLAMENNPNILDILYTPEYRIVFYNSFGKRLISNVHLFPHIGLKQKYLGYAFSQKHKMLIKVENYDSLMDFNDWLQNNVSEPQNYINNTYKSNCLLAELRYVKELKGIVTFHDTNATIGDINISLTDKLSKVVGKVAGRVARVGNRQELYKKFGFDNKFGLNLVRLMMDPCTLR